MQISWKTDAILAVAVAFALPVAELFVGDPLFAGPWYYLAVSMSAIAIGAVVGAKPLFLFGASCAVAVTFLPYAAYNLSLTRPEGLLVLFHLLSLPGAAIGTLVGAFYARRLSGLVATLSVGFTGVLSGFFLNQLVVCNTLMSCGALSVR